jgi:hypothetical protein
MEFNEQFIETAKVLWPKQQGFPPMNQREEALLGIVCHLMETLVFAMNVELTKVQEFEIQIMKKLGIDPESPL